jgi:hypothetical protein
MTEPKFKPIDPEAGDLMTLAEYQEAEADNFLTADDGFGEYATETQVSNIDTSEPAPEWATHVVWYNK